MATLWCLLEGTSTAFKVSVSLNEDVDDLKDKIVDKKRNRFKDIDANELQIFKVCPFRLTYSSQLIQPNNCTGQC